MAAAAQTRDDEAVAEAYTELMSTCIRCHSLYLAIPASE
jgi:cytochrome c556